MQDLNHNQASEIQAALTAYDSPVGGPKKPNKPWETAKRFLKFCWYSFLTVAYFAIAVATYEAVRWLTEDLFHEGFDELPILKFLSEAFLTAFLSIIMFVGFLHGLFVILELTRSVLENQDVIPALARWARRINDER